MKHIYLAAPLFTRAELSFNQQVYEYLVNQGYQVFLPQRECENKSEKELYQTCLLGLKSSSMVVAILDHLGQINHNIRRLGGTK